jgi:hypothetical protein
MTNRKQLAKQIAQQIPSLNLSNKKARTGMIDQLTSAGIEARMHAIDVEPGDLVGLMDKSFQMIHWSEEEFLEYLLGQILDILQDPLPSDQERLAWHRDSLLKFSQ